MSDETDAYRRELLDDDNTGKGIEVWVDCGTVGHVDVHETRAMRGASYTPAKARQLAQILLEAADVAERWKPSPIAVHSCAHPRCPYHLQLADFRKCPQADCPLRGPMGAD